MYVCLHERGGASNNTPQPPHLLVLYRMSSISTTWATKMDQDKPHPELVFNHCFNDEVAFWLYSSWDIFIWLLTWPAPVCWALFSHNGHPGLQQGGESKQLKPLSFTWTWTPLLILHSNDMLVKPDCPSVYNLWKHFGKRSVWFVLLSLALPWIRLE